MTPDLEQKARELWCAEAARIGVTYAAGDPSSDQPCVRAVIAGMRWAAEEALRRAEAAYNACMDDVADRREAWHHATDAIYRLGARHDETSEERERRLTALIADAEEEDAIAEMNKPSTAPAPTPQLARPSSCRLDDQGPVAATLKADPDNLPSGLRPTRPVVAAETGHSTSERAALVERAGAAWQMAVDSITGDKWFVEAAQVDGLRSEIELREAQLDAAEAANVALRAEVERLTSGHVVGFVAPDYVQRMVKDAHARGAIEALEKLRAVFNGYRPHDSIKVIGILEAFDDALRAARESKEKAT